MKTGIELIAEERQEQIKKHRYDLEEDKYYVNDELVDAAMFALTLKDEHYPKSWQDWWRNKMIAKSAALQPKQFKIERLKIAGALIAAEIDRLQVKGLGESKVIPSIYISGDGEILNIKITASELKGIVENNPRWTYKILDDRQFLNNFAANLEEYATPNSVEIGITELQALFETVVDETYTNGSEAIIDTEEKL